MDCAAANLALHTMAAKNPEAELYLSKWLNNDNYILEDFNKFLADYLPSDQLLALIRVQMVIHRLEA